MDSRTVMVGALVALSLVSTGCLRDARTCAVDSDCFGMERCVSGSCTTILQEPPSTDMTPAVDMPRDQEMRPDMEGGEWVRPLKGAQLVSTEIFAHKKFDSIYNRGCASALEGSGHLRVLFVDVQSFEKMPLVQMRWDPEKKSWTSTEISPPDGFLERPDIILDANSMGHVCAHDSLENELLYFREGPQGWTREHISIPAIELTHCRIALAGGEPVIMFESLGAHASSRALQLATRDAQGSWSIQPFDAQSHDFARPVGLWGDASGALVSAQMVSLARRTSVRVGARQGMRWAFEEEAPLYGSIHPSVVGALDGEMQVHLLLQELVGSDNVVLRYLHPTEPDRDLEVGAEYLADATFALAASATGEPHVVFGADNEHIYATRVTGAWTLWSMPEPMTFNPQCSNIHVDAMGRAHIIRDFDDGEHVSMMYRIVDVRP